MSMLYAGILLENKHRTRLYDAINESCKQERTTSARCPSAFSALRALLKYAIA